MILLARLLRGELLVLYQRLRQLELLQRLVLLHDRGELGGGQMHGRVVIAEQLVVPGGASELSQVTALVQEGVLRGGCSGAAIELGRDVDFVLLMTSSFWLSLQGALYRHGERTALSTCGRASTSLLSLLHQTALLHCKDVDPVRLARL